ncbi:MAG: VWA domain-containing protein [Myxococcota bacterium]
MAPSELVTSRPARALCALCVVSFVVLGGARPTQAYPTHDADAGSTLAEVFESAAAWASKPTPWKVDGYGMGIHPWLTALSLARYEQITGETLDEAIAQQVILGSIEEDFSVPGTQAPNAYPIVSLTDSLVSPDVRDRARQRAENHFFGVDAITGEELPILVDGSEWDLVAPSNALEWALSDERNACALGPAVEGLEDANDEERLRAYRCLGHALHVLQDLSHPAHVRNDMFVDGLDAHGYYLSRMSPSELWQLVGGWDAVPDVPPSVETVADAATYIREIADFTSKRHVSDDTAFAFKHGGVHPPEVPHYEDGDYFRSGTTGAPLAFKGNLFHAVRYAVLKDTGDTATAEATAKRFAKIDEAAARTTFIETAPLAVSYGAALVESFVGWEEELQGPEPYSDPTDQATTDMDVVVTQVDASGAPDAVKVYAMVTTQQGQPIEHLTVGNFAVAESIGGTSEAADVVSVTTAESSGEAVSACLVIDSSGSMDSGPGSKLEAALDAASLFVDQMKFNDRAAIIDFSSDVTLLQDFTSDGTVLHDALSLVVPGGGTRAWDAVLEGVTATAVQAGARAVILLSDGADSESSASLTDAIAAADQADVPVFAIGLGVDPDTEQRLVQLTDGTHAGKDASGYFPAPSPADLATLYAAISNALKKTYIVTWASTGSSGDQVDAELSVTYTAAQGTFTDVFDVPYQVP